MKNRSLKWSFLVISTLSAGHVSMAQTPEIRGVWCSRFQWTSANPTTARNLITTTMDNMVTGHFNTIFFQVRGQCDTLYPSPNEPWSPLITSPDGVDPGWDPLDFAVTNARARNLKIHAYFNTHTIWGSASAPGLSNYPNHIYYQHGNPSDPAHRDWLQRDDVGNIVPHNEYLYMNPGIPEADAHVRREAVYLVRTYDIDGLHFDRVRMTGRNYGRAPIAVARWDNPGTAEANDGPGNPHKLGWGDFMRECVTRQVMNICGECWGENPQAVMSSSPLGLWEFSAYDHIPGYSSGFHYAYPLGQDAKAWMQMGAQDFIVPQIYWANGGAKPDFNELLDDWFAAGVAAGRYVVPGSNMSNGQTELEDHVLYTRSLGAAGHNIWQSAITEFSTWSSPGHPYESATPPVPEFPWRSTEGVITGHVWIDACQETPAVDTWINRSGSTWTALSSGDGFFSFLRVAPGTYTITVNHPVMGLTTIPNVVVTAGQATNLEIGPEAATPIAPTSLSATALDHTARLEWDDVSEGELGFEIWRATGGDGPYALIDTVPAEATEFLDSPAEPETYFYKVRSFICSGFSDYSNITSATVAVPTQPLLLQALNSPGETTITLVWSDAEHESSYEIYRSTNVSGPFVQLASLQANSTSYLDDGVLYVTDTTWNGEFFYFVRPVNGFGAGTDSSMAIGAPTQMPDLIMESRSWNGGVPEQYAEGLAGGGAWLDTIAKSLVENPRARGQGARFTGNSSVGSFAEFTPRIFLQGNYEIMVTGPNAVVGLNVHSPGTIIDVRHNSEIIASRTFNNSRFNLDLADKWLSMSPPLVAQFPVGMVYKIRLTNTHTGSAGTGNRFSVDAIRLKFLEYASAKDWMLY